MSFKQLKVMPRRRNDLNNSSKRALRRNRLIVQGLNRSQTLTQQPPVGRSVSCKEDIQRESLASLRDRKARRKDRACTLNKENCSYACTIEKNEGHVVEASRTSSFLCFSFSLSPPSPCTSPPFPTLYLWPQREST